MWASPRPTSAILHLTVLVCAPGMGDDVQMIKAGVRETADLFAVNKADLPEAQGVMRQLRAAAHLASGVPAPVLATIATSGSGVAELLDVLDRTRATKVLPQREERLRRLRRTLETMAIEELQRGLATLDACEIHRLCESGLAGSCDFASAIQGLLELGQVKIDGKYGAGSEPRTVR